MWLDLDNADYIRQTLGFPNDQIGLRVDRDLIAADGTIISHDSRYFADSSDPNTVRADQLLAAVRQHWHVENGLFFLKDRWWDEDRHVLRRPGLGEDFAKLTSLAATVLRACYPPDQPIRARADYIQWKPAIGLRLLGLK